MPAYRETGDTKEEHADLDIGRRSLLKLTGAGVAALGAASIFNISKSEAQNMSEEWDKLFPRSANVDHQKVAFKNRYGITLAGDLYLPKDRANRRLPALAVGGPFGAVKEQSSGLYAQTMAERGFVTLAFDGPIPEKAAASPAMSPRRKSIPRISAPLSTSSDCTLPWTASGSASSVFAVGAAWH